MKLPKKGRRTEKMTVFILFCDGQFALQKRPNKGLLAGLWQFPNCPGHLETADALALVEKIGLNPREIYRQVEKKHIFTHIEWEMRGYFLEVSSPEGDYQWMTAEQIDREAALPTAFRQFWEERDYV